MVDHDENEVWYDPVFGEEEDLVNVLVHDVTPDTVPMTPIEIATGQKPDISAFLTYRWW